MSFSLTSGSSKVEWDTSWHFVLLLCPVTRRRDAEIMELEDIIDDILLGQDTWLQSTEECISKII